MPRCTFWRAHSSKIWVKVIQVACKISRAYSVHILKYNMKNKRDVMLIIPSSCCCHDCPAFVGHSTLLSLHFAFAQNFAMLLLLKSFFFFCCVKVFLFTLFEWQGGLNAEARKYTLFLSHILRKKFASLDISQHLLTGAYRNISAAIHFSKSIVVIFVCSLYKLLGDF